MKRLVAAVLFISLIIFSGSLSYAKSQYSEVLAKMENSVLGLDYQNQTDIQRLNRLEKTVYGEVSTESVQKRITKLSSDLSADVLGKEIKPKRDTFSDEDNQNNEYVPKEDKSVSYPMVDMLERTVFKQEFKNLDVEKRLSKLEQKAFDRTYSDDLSSRVDRLRNAILPNNNSVAQSDDDSDYNSDNDSDNNADNSSLSPQSEQENYETVQPQNMQPNYNKNNSVLDSYNSDSDIIVPLGSLEKKILRRTYPNDAVSTRLVRLEEKLFKSTFTDDDEQTRLDRIASAYQAKKSSGRYDNNTFSQHMATAVQVGAFLLMILAAVL